MKLAVKKKEIELHVHTRRASSKTIQERVYMFFHKANQILLLREDEILHIAIKKNKNKKLLVSTYQHRIDFLLSYKKKNNNRRILCALQTKKKGFSFSSNQLE